MTHTAQPVRVAIGQIGLHWTIEDNMAAMARSITIAAEAGASICGFPELAVTGFHRGIRELAKPERVTPAVECLQALAAQHRIAIAVGAPTFGDTDDARFNSHLLIDASGARAATVDKAGLTEPEATFFQRGGIARPHAVLAGLRCSAVICREIEDHDEVVASLAGHPCDLLFWPGQMGTFNAKTVSDPPEHVQQAQRLARSLGAWVVQSNWPNALNRPEESAGLGRSAVIAPSGELIFRLPVEAAGVGVFALGARTFDWFAL